MPVTTRSVTLPGASRGPGSHPCTRPRHRKKTSEIWGDLTNTTGPIWRLLTLTNASWDDIYTWTIHMFTASTGTYPDFCLTESLDSYKKIRRSNSRTPQKTAKLPWHFSWIHFPSGHHFDDAGGFVLLLEPRTVENSSKNGGMKFNFRKHPRSWKEKKLQIHQPLKIGFLCQHPGIEGPKQR